MLLCTTAAAAAKAAKASETAKASATAHVATEDVAKHGEDVVHVKPLASETASATHAGMSELVVACTLVGVAENVVGLGGLLELLLGFLVARIAVGVVFDGHFLVGLLYLVFRGAFLYAKHLVVVSLFCHVLYWLWSGM